MKQSWFILILLLAGCDHSSKPVPVKPATETAPLASAQGRKDLIVTTKSQEIDAAVAGTAAQAVVNEATQAQRDAIIAAPAAQVESALKERDAIIKAQADQIAEKDKKIESLTDAELKTQARTLRFIGLGAFAVAALLAYARQLPLAAASALTGLICLGLAQLISQPWFMPAVGALTIVALVAFGVAAWHAYKQGTLAQKTEEEAARLKATLTKVVPTLDSALKDVDKTAQETVLGALSRAMDEDHKQVIRKARSFFQ